MTDEYPFPGADTGSHGRESGRESPSSHEVDDGSPHERGEVKWFNPTKGFGFVRFSERDEEAFLHISSLVPHGVKMLNPGAEVICVVGQGPRGLQVERVVSIESEGVAEPGSSSAPEGAPRGRPAPQGEATEICGEVKFFNARKGFGFVSPDEGGRDVFLPARVLTRCGILSVKPGQRLRLQVRAGLRGLSADAVEEI